MEISFRSASTTNSSTLSILNSGVGVIYSSSSAVLKSFAILITNEYISKSKRIFTILGDWINVTSLLYE